MIDTFGRCECGKQLGTSAVCNHADTVIYKIPWQKYDPENPPEMHRLYIICTNNVKPPKMSIAQLSESPSERIMWLTPNGFIADRVTHYAHINLPGEE